MLREKMEFLKNKHLELEKDKDDFKKDKETPEVLRILKHYPSSVREWNNSVYFYNKNNLNLIPSSGNSAIKIIKGFFNLYNINLEEKMRTKPLLVKLRRLSSNRIYLSKGEFKHNNNNVLINLYLFNRQKHNYLLKLKNVYLKDFFSKKNINQNFVELLRLVYLKGLNSIKEINKDKYSLIKGLDIKDKYKINTFKYLSNYSKLLYKRLLNLTMTKLHLYFFYKQLIYINKSKLNYNYLRLLKKHLEKLYNKNVEFNLINLKRFYLNSDILSEMMKLRITMNKRNILFLLKKLNNKVKIRKKVQYLDEQESVENINLLRKSVFSELKYKHVRGFRLQVNGRLSKRFTASRSVHKLTYKGNLHNIDANLRGISSVILKGNLRSNLQHTKLKSKLRIGSFGIKGWVSGD